MLITITSETLTDIRHEDRDSRRQISTDQQRLTFVSLPTKKNGTSMMNTPEDERPWERVCKVSYFCLLYIIFQLLNNTFRNRPQNEMQLPTVTSSREFVPNMWSITMMKRWRLACSVFRIKFIKTKVLVSESEGHPFRQHPGLILILYYIRPPAWLRFSTHQNFESLQKHNI